LERIKGEHVMIAANYFASTEFLKLIEQLDSEELSPKGKAALESLKAKLLLFKCPSCGKPLGLSYSFSAWSDAFIADWKARVGSIPVRRDS
jgi:hypothetical protein